MVTVSSRVVGGVKNLTCRSRFLRSQQAEDGSTPDLIVDPKHDKLSPRLAPIAQMVERVLGKDEVCGSIPHRGSVDPGGSATAVGLESG